MGAAAYGDPSRYYPAVRSLIRWNEQTEFEIDLSYFNYFDFDVSPMYRPKLEALLGPARRPAEALEQRHYDVAAAIQKVTEEYLGAALVALHNETKCATACLSGGVFMNSMFNGKATLESPFEQLYVPHAPDDNGNSIGAALWVAWQEHEVSSAGGISKSPFLGASYNDDEIRDTLDRYRLPYRHSDDDARDATMKDKINTAVKYREAYRPFAPSIIDEATQEYFAIDRDIDAPYMERVLPIRDAMRSRIPAVVHADGTGRLQAVRSSDNPLFHKLISAFCGLTGVPLVLNTSFNLNGEPIVESPTDAIRTF